MPLSFQSLSHGTIAFGFFNIESDMLLLDRYFFFATDFCEMVNRLADSENGAAAGLSWKVDLIDSPEKIGDLMGAIHGVRFSGFIGDVYRRYPFPEDPLDFKQNPNGMATQAVIKNLIETYAVETGIRVQSEPDGARIGIGNYHFDRPGFHQLLDYVWLGGYPRWKSEVRPECVLAMHERTLVSTAPLFNGLVFS